MGHVTTVYPMYDITLTGSIIGAGLSPEDAGAKAAAASLHFPGRMIRVHGHPDMNEVIAEYRDGAMIVQGQS